MKLKFYGSLRDKLGAELEFDPPAGTDTVAKLRDILADRFPDASTDFRKRTRACVGDSIVGEDHALASGQVIEFFPPLSGG